MTKRFDSDIFFKNINYLLKEKGIKIGELESYADVSTGYVSRVRKEESAKPGIDFVVKVADKFDVSVDDLIGVDMEGLTNTEAYILDFLNKLIADTKAEKMLWEKESPSYFGTLNHDGFGNTDHPLISLYKVKHVNDRMIVSSDMLTFNSDTFGIQTKIHGDCYNLALKNGATLYLMDIESIPDSVDVLNSVAKELLIYLPNSGRQFLCSTKSQTFEDKINLLFATIADYFKHPQIKSDFRNVIDAFMSDDWRDDPAPEDPFPGYPEEPPF